MTKEEIIQSATKKSEWLKEAKWRKENRDWLNKSGKIASSVLKWCGENKVKIGDLAKSLGYSEEFLNDLLKGSFNMSLKTICELEDATGLTLVVTPKK